MMMGADVKYAVRHRLEQAGLLISEKDIQSASMGRANQIVVVTWCLDEQPWAGLTDPQPGSAHNKG